MSENKPNVPAYPKRVLMDLQGGWCNLRCPKCFVHGIGYDKELIKKLRGHMPIEKVEQVLDEIKDSPTLIQPNLWTEPLLAKNFREHVHNMKKRGIAVALNTNGLLLDDGMAQFFIDVELDSVFISIDATTPEVLQKTRGTTKLTEIHEAVFRMLRIRGGKKLPRIGVSFTTEEANRHQRDEFVKFWIQHVDAVRVGELYETSNNIKTMARVEKRVPCQSLYETLPIHFNGQVSICCLDGNQTTNMGNVFEEGVSAVWHGKVFSQIRHYHETGQYDKVPFCENCDVWANYTYKEEEREEDGILIRQSPLMTYYNRMDRLDNYQGKKAFSFHNE